MLRSSIRKEDKLGSDISSRRDPVMSSLRKEERLGISSNSGGRSLIRSSFDSIDSSDFLGLLLDDNVLSCSSRELPDDALLIIVMLSKRCKC
jgi:hypothetical protein